MIGMIDTHDDWYVASMQSIPANADLNNYLRVGRYTCPSTATANSLVNVPTKEAGTLIVTNVNNRVQEIVPGESAWVYLQQWYVTLYGHVYVRVAQIAGDGVPTYQKWKKFTQEVIS